MVDEPKLDSVQVGRLLDMTPNSIAARSCAGSFPPKRGDLDLGSRRAPYWHMADVAAYQAWEPKVGTPWKGVSPAPDPPPPTPCPSQDPTPALTVPRSVDVVYRVAERLRDAMQDARAAGYHVELYGTAEGFALNINRAFGAGPVGPGRVPRYEFDEDDG